MGYEKKEDCNGGVMVVEDGSYAVNNGISNMNSGISSGIENGNGLQISQQQQSQNSVVNWERFLPIRSLKVLLVESDFSTRQLVCALLRNCSYEVTSVENGIQAWKILEDLNNHIDLVLTEVVMPILSGIGLLSKIMNHKTLKNIPVIMMSSHDSMGIVFKCLSKGAVDFLVKPIRKNELKNLWQHVWRRCHSSSGSGSESESRTGPKKSANSSSNEESGNDSDSGDELGENGSHGPIIRDGSDNGSGTQNSWTIRGAELDSSQPMSPSYHLADAPDSTCAQVIHTKPEMILDRRLHITDQKDEEKNQQIDDFPVPKDSEIRGFRNPDFLNETYHENASSCPSGKRLKNLSDLDSKPLENGQLERSRENLKHGNQAPKTTSADINNSQPYESKSFDDSNIRSNISHIKDKAHFDSVELPSVELTLRRHKEVGDGGSATNDDRNVLRRSDLSAFSKYHTAASANQGLMTKVDSSSPVDCSSVAMKTDAVINVPFHSSGALLNQQSNGSSNNNDMISTAKNVASKPEIVADKSESTSAFNSIHSSAFQPVQPGCTVPDQHMNPGMVNDMVANTQQEKCKNSHQQVQVHHHHHHHHYYHPINSVPQYQSQLDHDDISLKDMGDVAPQCGSTNVVEGQTEGNAANCSVNGSASSSNHGSNGKNGSNTALNAGPTNIGSDNIAAGNSDAGGTCGKISKNAVDEDRIAIREAALSKFRLKRKERCFEKRSYADVTRKSCPTNNLSWVRYQSRKRLAEQRPRVKGQFVRQTASDNRTEIDSQSNDHTSEDNSCDGIR